MCHKPSQYVGEGSNPIGAFSHKKVTFATCYARKEGLHIIILQGRIRGGGGPGGQGPLLLGTPKLHKNGKNVARVPAKTPRLST